MKQYTIKPNEEYSTKSISIWADEYHEDKWNGLIFTLSGEVIAIFNKNDFIVKE